jgi:hypothetical protein
MNIDVDSTELSEENYEEFMDALDVEFERQYPNHIGINTKYSETQSKEQWLLDCHGATVQDIIDADVECWEG